jgi:hypothetical protein
MADLKKVYQAPTREQAETQALQSGGHLGGELVEHKP